MRNEDMHVLLLKYWSMRGNNFQDFDNISEVKVVPNWKQRFDADPLLKNVHQPPTTSVFAPTRPIAAHTCPFTPMNHNVLQIPTKPFVVTAVQTISSSSSPSVLQSSAPAYVPMDMQATSTISFRAPHLATHFRHPHSAPPSRPPVSTTPFRPPSFHYPFRAFLLCYSSPTSSFHLLFPGYHTVLSPIHYNSPHHRQLQRISR